MVDRDAMDPGHPDPLRVLYVNPFPEDDHATLLDCLPENRVLFGSDWPHPEGIPSPADYPSYLPEHTPRETIRALMRDNARRLLRLDP